MVKMSNMRKCYLKGGGERREIKHGGRENRGTFLLLLLPGRFHLLFIVAWEVNKGSGLTGEGVTEAKKRIS